MCWRSVHSFFLLHRAGLSACSRGVVGQFGWVGFHARDGFDPQNRCIKLPQALSVPTPLALVMHFKLSAMKLLVLVVALATAWVGLASDEELRAGLQDLCASKTPFPMA